MCESLPFVASVPLKKEWIYQAYDEMITVYKYINYCM